MKKAKIFLWTTLITVTSILYLTIVPNFRTLATGLESQPVAAGASQKVMDATIQILVFRTTSLDALGVQVGEGLSIEAMLSRGDAELRYGIGLGTLVEHHGKTLLYTHDHWGDLDALGMVQFRNAAGDLLLEVDGAAFKDMVRYQDGGTMILGKSEEGDALDYINALVWTSQAKYNRALVPASFGSIEDVEAGSAVIVARQGRDGQEVELIQAVVESIETRWGEQVFKLRSGNGETIIPGDSGGGIWLNGLVVGNMWKTNYTYRWNWEALKLEKSWADTSYAAELVENVDEVVQSIEAPAQEVEMDLPTNEQEF